MTYRHDSTEYVGSEPCERKVRRVVRWAWRFAAVGSACVGGRIAVEGAPFWTCVAASAIAAVVGVGTVLLAAAVAWECGAFRDGN